MFDEKFWLAIAFFSFLAIIIKHALPMITAGLDQKSKQIAKDLLDAKEMKEQAKQLLIDAENFYKEATVFSDKLIKDSAVEAQKLLVDANEAAKIEVAKKMTALNNRIKQEEENAVREIKLKIISSAVSSIQTSLTGAKKENLTNSVKNSLSDIGKLIH